MLPATASERSQKLHQDLLRSAKSGNFEHIKTVLTTNKHEIQFSDLVYNATGDSILHVAASKATASDILFILQHFEDPLLVNCRNKDGKTPLHEACQFSRKENVKVLLENGAEVNAIKRADWTPLMLACAKTQGLESVEIVKLLLEKGAMVSLKNKDGWNALHLVCRDGNVDVFKLLLSKGADLGAATNNGRTALHIAALHGNLDIVAEIIKRKPDSVNIRDNCGNTALHEAVLGDHRNVCRFLIEHNSETDTKNSVNYGLLHLAASVGSLDMIRYLVGEVKCSVNSVALNGLTPLHCAARKGYKDACELLVTLGADEDFKDSFGRTAKDYLTA